MCYIVLYMETPNDCGYQHALEMMERAWMNKLITAGAGAIILGDMYNITSNSALSDLIAYQKRK